MSLSDVPNKGEIRIPLSKTKIILMFIGSLIFVFLVVWIFQNPALSNTSDPLVMQLVAIGGFVFFTIAAVYSAIKLFDQKPGLIINEEGITDNSSGAAVGFVQWDNIKDIKYTNVMGTRIIALLLHDPDVILNRQKGIKRFITKINKDGFDSPVQISSNTLRCNFDELHEIINNRLLEEKSNRI
jgi:quinol-cytochrome oxidoreductase complex cytochrome b subunit